MKNQKITFLNLIPKLTPTFIIMVTISMPLNLFKANKVLAQTVNIQASTYQKLQKNLIAQNPTEAALVISERGRTRALVDLLAKRLSATNDLSVTPSIEKIKQVAKQQNATLVEYSIITDEFNVEGKQEAKESELYIWAIKPTGEVVLTGCDTALGKITGDGAIGLSRAFLGAGADSVIGSLWAVDDMATAFLITEFYGNLRKNTVKAGALRQAMLETMKKYPNPQYWAAFTLIGLF